MGGGRWAGYDTPAHLIRDSAACSLALFQRGEGTHTMTEANTKEQESRLRERLYTTVADLLPAMLASNGWISDKPEGTAITADGQVYVITDNDGVDDWSGETLFLRLGDVDDLFADGE